MPSIEVNRSTDIDRQVLDRHNVRPRDKDGRPDQLYHRADALLLPTEFLPRVRELNGVLAEADLGGPLEYDAPASGTSRSPSAPLLTPLRLATGSAGATLEGLRAYMDNPQHAAEHGELAAVVAALSLERVAFHYVPIFGEPGSKGHGYPGRSPVAVLAPPRRRRSLAEIGCGRRPVVALLDTGVLPHTWFGPIGPASGPDAFVVEPEDWHADPANEMPGPKVVPALDQGPLLTHAGHGTFIAGLIRQLAPDARVLSMHVMHSDGGAVYEHLLLNALDYLRGRVESGDPDRFVDVVCLALGYREASPEDAQYTSRLRDMLWSLGSRGVQVVASVGNHGDDVETYPGALAAAMVAPYRWLHGVGARNPNGTHASYSNHGDWVTDWEVATAVASSFPAFDASNVPEPGPTVHAGEAEPTEGFDPDDFTGGYAIWSGTSFAAGALAGRLARALIPDPEEATSDALLDVGTEAARERARKAYAAYLSQQ